MSMKQLENVIVDLLGNDHPVVNRILNGDKNLHFVEVLAAAFGMMMLENQQLHNEIDELESRVFNLENPQEEQDGA